MNEVLAFLQKSSVFYLATVDTDGKPRNRPFGPVLEHNGKLWFCTKNLKKVYAQLQNNPYVEICTCTPGFSWIRLSGKVVFEDNREVKEAFLQKPVFQKNFQSADNPTFEVFYLDEAKAAIIESGGTPPKEYTL